MVIRRWARRGLVLTLTATALGGAGLITQETLLRRQTITAYFATATAIYPGDQVRIAGVEVGTIKAIEAQASRAKLTLAIESDIPVPADAKAVIVAQNLVSARYVQLTPAYEDNGPTMPDGAVIPVERTAIPVEWDEVKTQLMRLATDLGPGADMSTTSVGRFIDSAAGAMDGNGAKLRDTLRQLSESARILADGGGDIVATITNLQIFVTALRDSNTQIVSFQDRLATVTNVIDNSRSDLDGALTNLAVAVDDIKRFIAGTRDGAGEQIQRLSAVTQNLVDHREDLENILHNAPTSFSNAYNIFHPDSGTPIGSFAFQNFANPLQLLCAGIGAVENATAPETAKLCAQYLSPALRLMNFNYLPFPVNPFLMPAARPEHIIYSPPDLENGKPGAEPDDPPSVSAYTGDAEGEQPTDLPSLLLPAEAVSPPGPPAEGTPPS